MPGKDEEEQVIEGKASNEKPPKNKDVTSKGSKSKGAERKEGNNKPEKSKPGKSKERKSKEHKSKEHKSKEHKSKEHKSKEHKSKERKSKEHKSKERKSTEGKSKPGKSKQRKSADTAKRKARSESPARKVADKKTLSRKDRSPVGKKAATKLKPSVEKLMASFKDARPSDVSDKVFVATSPVHGKGLFATRRLKAGTVISRLHGMPTFDDGIYVLWITDELGLELTNDLKFINHDKNPNAAYSDLDVTIVRDVAAGEELLHDYGW